MLHLVHGIREFKGGAHMAPLQRELGSMGVEASDVVYGPVWIPITNQCATNAVMDSVRDGDDVVAYSNGAWAVHQALELGLRVRNLYLISPALNVAAAFPNVEAVRVYASSGDDAVLVGKLWRLATRILPWRWLNPHGWGAMGRYGYQGASPRVTTHMMPDHVGHGWNKHPEIVRFLAREIAEGVTRPESGL